jgi:hypothetical protein
MAALIVLAMPVSAGVAAGVVADTVLVTPAMPPVTCTATSYQGSGVMAGIFNGQVDTSGLVWPGGSSLENLSGAIAVFNGQIGGRVGFSKWRPRNWQIHSNESDDEGPSSPA